MTFLGNELRRLNQRSVLIISATAASSLLVYVLLGYLFNLEAMIWFQMLFAVTTVATLNQLGIDWSKSLVNAMFTIACAGLGAGIGDGIYHLLKMLLA